ncbi:hypothetical protein FZEAL_713 [Fusarium zealandicum]|uniref:Alcohol acetyltransferase n=1 Tax=Fusarium zealandicum TaxID=1053134 RepID=A0A8H4XPH3_9HYPO|nr:hypothetical protein FZEAL_713 [Fusarium zealandicum]
MNEEQTKAYTLVRGTGVLQRLWYLYHRLGIWSNILVAAHYTSVDGNGLTKEVLLDALGTVAMSHPSLWQVFVKRPSSNPGCHGLHTAVLRTIDLDKCIEYLDDDQGEPGITSDILEYAHNEWLWTADEPDRPLWKLLVKGRNIIFVYHHSLGDGVSGMVFHRELLAALNSPTVTKTGGAEHRPNTIIHANDAAQVPLEPEDVWDGKDSFMEMLWTTIVSWFVALYYGNARIYANLPPPKPRLQSATAVAEPHQRTVTRISLYRIPANEMSLIIKACRANQTTFTPLLLTMLTIVLATEFYPDAKVGATRFNFDLRPYLPMSRIGGGTANGTIVNASAGWQRWHRLAPFRRVLTTKADETGTPLLDREAVWGLVKEYKEDMTRSTSGKALRNWISVKRAGTDLENLVNAFEPIGAAVRHTFSVSNIGAFSEVRAGDEERDRGLWQIDDMQFSAGAVNGNQGTHGAIFHVGGVRGGDTVINATYEDGVVSREMAEGIVKRAVARILEIV